MSFKTDLSTATNRFPEREQFFWNLYELANSYEDAKNETTKSALTTFLRKNVDSMDLITVISYNIAPHTRALIEEILPVLTKICEHRKALELLTA